MMNNLDWIRLGGMLAQRWPQIDFGTVDIRRVDGDHSVCALWDNAPHDIVFETEEIEMVKWVWGDERGRAGYGPRANVLLVNY
jgi:hypothetical protein